MSFSHTETKTWGHGSDSVGQICSWWTWSSPVGPPLVRRVCYLKTSSRHVTFFLPQIPPKINSHSFYRHRLTRSPLTIVILQLYNQSTVQFTKMRFFTTVATLGLAAFALAQDSTSESSSEVSSSTSSAEPSSTSLSAEAQCLKDCMQAPEADEDQH